MYRAIVVEMGSRRQSFHLFFPRYWDPFKRSPNPVTGVFAHEEDMLPTRSFPVLLKKTANKRRVNPQDAWYYKPVYTSATPYPERKHGTKGIRPYTLATVKPRLYLFFIKKRASFIKNIQCCGSGAACAICRAGNGAPALLAAGYQTYSARTNV